MHLNVPVIYTPYTSLFVLCLEQMLKRKIKNFQQKAEVETSMTIMLQIGQKFGQIGHQTVELAALEQWEKSKKSYNGKMF